MTLPESKQPDESAPKVEPEPETNLSARAGAESALSEFQRKMIDNLTDAQAKDAYMRLMVGRGFDRPRPAPVMTIHTAIVSGESKAAGAKAVPLESGAVETKPEALSQARRRDFLNGLAHFFRKPR